MREIVVVFANSIKHGQHCVAGKRLSDKNWVRLVADDAGAELNHDKVKYTNRYGTYEVKPLQKIDMNIGRHVPLPHQPENYISEGGWTQAYSIVPNELAIYTDAPDSLWGTENRVDEIDVLSGAISIEQSLYLVQVDALEISFEEDKRRASFSYKGNNYCLPITDPKFDKLVSGEQKHNNFICVSLGECYKGFHYKIIATIL
jgi:hypothetical protein